MPTRLAPVAFLVALWIAAPLQADPPPEPADAQDGEKAATVLDFMPLVVGLKEELEQHKKPPAVDGPGGELHAGWRSSVKRRAPRIAAKAKELTRSSLWEFDEKGTAALRLKESQWGPAIRRLAAMYTELGGASKGFDDITVSADRAIALWDRRNPPPVTTGLTPAGVLLRRVRAEIAAYRLLKKIVPGWLLRELDRLILRERVEIAARVEARRRWEEDRARAHAEIQERVEATRVLVEQQQALFDGQMESVRALTAALQDVEEARLKARVDAFSPDDPIHGATQELFPKMARGRVEAERFNDPRTSRWGSLLRQGWMVPRAKILREIAKAEKRAAAASKEKPDGG
jgi:hypothetical protein